VVGALGAARSVGCSHRPSDGSSASSSWLKQYARAAAVGAGLSGLTFWAFGEWNDRVGPFHRDDFRNIGVAHGAITASVVIRFGQ